MDIDVLPLLVFSFIAAGMNAASLRFEIVANSINDIKSVLPDYEILK
jgi:hypothetical protein